MKVFIYGTLKKGQVRSSLMDGEKYLGAVKTAPKYRLFHVPGGGSGFPALVEQDEKGCNVQGELYEVSEEKLKELDGIEGVDFGLYKRINVELDSGEAKPLAYAFCHSVDGLRDCGGSWPEKAKK